MKQFLFIIWFLLTSVATAGAMNQTYYVNASTGDDTRTCAQAKNPSTPRLRIRSIATTIVPSQTCFDSLGGDKVVIAGGTYHENLNFFVGGVNGNPNILTWSGGFTAGDIVTLSPNGGDHVIQIDADYITLDFGTQRCWNPSLFTPPWSAGSQFCGLVVDGTHITPADNPIVASGPTHVGVTFQGIEINGGGSSGAAGHGMIPAGNLNQYIWIHNIGNSTNFAYGIYETGNNIIVQYMDIDNVSGYAIHNFNSNPPYPSNNTYRNLRISQTGLTTNFGGILLSSGSNNVAYNNLLFNITGPAFTILGANGNPNQAYENTIYGNGVWPAFSYIPNAGSVIENNIVANSTTTTPKFSSYPDFTQEGATSPIVISHNLCDVNTGKEAQCAVTGDPLFLSTTSSSANFLKINTGSPAIDAGGLLAAPYNVDFAGNARPAGQAFDIGAYEFSGTPPTLRTLNIATSNPASGCTMMFTPDQGGFSQATAPVSAVYFDGTVVMITPQSPCGGNNFQKWQLDGVDYSNVANVQVTMGADHTITAFYVTPAPTTHTVTITSQNPNSGAHINVAPNDIQNRSSVVTQGGRVYNTGAAIVLTARPHANDALMCVLFEEGSGTTAADSCGSGLSGTLVNGATWVTGNPSGHAVSFVAPSNQYISIPDSNLFAGLTGLDVSIDIKPTAPLTGFIAGAGKNYVWYVYASSTGYSNASSQPCTNGPLFVIVDSLNNFHTVCSTTALTSGVWTTIRGRFNGSLLELLINGSVVDSITAPFVIANSGGLIQLGASQFGENLSGAVDNLYIYDSYESAIPPVAGNAFQSWSGCDSSSTVTCNVTLSADKSVQANYVSPVTQFTITVNSVNPTNVAGITVDTPDINGATTGTASFTRIYQNGPYVTFTAPATSGSNNFVSWTGCDAVDSRSCHVNATSNRTITVTYSSPTVRALTLVSVNPASGVAITGITADLSSQTSCATPNCALTYNDSTSVVATAPATVGSNTFSAWTGCTSVSGVGNRTCNMTMNADKVGTVTYTTPPAACTTSIKAGSVSITVKGNSLIANCNGG